MNIPVIDAPTNRLHPPDAPVLPRRLLSAALWLMILIGAFFVLNVGSNLILPLLIAFIAVYLVKTAGAMFANLSFGRFKIPAMVANLLGFLVILAMTYGLMTIITNNARRVAEEAPKYQASLIQLQDRLFDRLGAERSEILRENIRQVEFGSIVTTMATSLAGLLGNTTLILIYAIFFMLEMRFFSAKLHAMFPQETRRQVIDNILSRIDQDIRTYLGVKTLISLTTAVLSYAVMKIVGLDFAEFWALLIFIFNFIPTIGSVVATILPMLLAIIQFESLVPFLVIAIGIISIQQIMGSIIEPNILGQSLNLSPLVVIVSLVLWGMVWGIVGMFLCVPLTVIIMIVLSNFESTRWAAILLSKNGEVKGV